MCVCAHTRRALGMERGVAGIESEAKKTIQEERGEEEEGWEIQYFSSQEQASVTSLDPWRTGIFQKKIKNKK
jgi:hypothetical protein